jgi:MEKHLA domain
VFWFFVDLAHPSVMPAIWEREEIIAHTECLARSLGHWTGRDLMPGAADRRELSQRVFEAPFVLVSHGTEADPILNYGNQSALKLWDISWDDLTRMPSRLTAEAPNREERARLLGRVTRDGFIDDYSGVRIARSGGRFRISRATVWNLLTPDGAPCGQAAMFSEWTFLD